MVHLQSSWNQHSSRLTLVIARLYGFAVILFASHCFASDLEQGNSQGTPSIQGRNVHALEEWQFVATPEAAGPILSADDLDIGETVNLPHIFRQSGQKDESIGWYYRTLDISHNKPDRHYFLRLDGAASVSDVYVNGSHVGQHRGAFTAAVFNLTTNLNKNTNNVISIRVSNSEEEASNCLSRSNLYYINGGLFRPVSLFTTGRICFDPYMGSTGLFLTPESNGDKWNLLIKAHLDNPSQDIVDATLCLEVKDPDKRVVRTIKKALKLNPGKAILPTIHVQIEEPQLWGIRDPKLYSVSAELLVKSEVTDSIVEYTGLRKIEMKDGQFLLNNKPFQVLGFNKHQQNEQNWNAMTSEELVADWKLLSDLGPNTVRLAHYPHPKIEYQTADELGIAVWAENGLAGQKWDKQDGNNTGEKQPTADGERITREMVYQNWNHPSIIFWSSGNETYQHVASRYAELIRELDVTRLITYASAGETPNDVDFVAHNTYQGWYYDHFSDFSKLPDNAYVSETGAGTWSTHHVPHNKILWRVNHFEPEEYGQLFAEYRLQSVFRDNADKHHMYLWWAFRDFYNKKFKNNRNTKGVVHLSGAPKDLYFLHQAFLRSNYPVLHICGQNHFYRQDSTYNAVKVYSNAKNVELLVNGISVGTKSNGEYIQPDTPRNIRRPGGDIVTGTCVNNVFFWDKPLLPGKNVIEARSQNGTSQTAVVYLAGDSDRQTSSLIYDLMSSNPKVKPIVVDRTLKPNSPVYYPVDGSADNTFSKVPELLLNSQQISTPRLSESNNITDLQFTAGELPIEIYAMFSTGTYPTEMLKKPNKSIVEEAKKFSAMLITKDFVDTNINGEWRGHNLWLCNAMIWKRLLKPGESITMPGHCLDYSIFVKPTETR